MSQKEPPPEIAPLVTHGRQTLSVVAVKSLGNVRPGVPPHVMLRLGDDANIQVMQLSAAEARQIAISLLQAAEMIGVTLSSTLPILPKRRSN